MERIAEFGQIANIVLKQILHWIVLIASLCSDKTDSVLNTILEKLIYAT